MNIFMTLLYAPWNFEYDNKSCSFIRFLYYAVKCAMINFQQHERVQHGVERGVKNKEFIFQTKYFAEYDTRKRMS